MTSKKNKCIFCLLESTSFSRREHIIPESLGGEKLLPPGMVCDKCNQYLSKIENEALTKSVLSLSRSLMSIKTKKGKYSHHKGFRGAVKGGENGTAFILPENKIRQLIKSGKGWMIFLDTGKEALVRLLIKIGLELIATSKKADIYSKIFDNARNAVRCPKIGSKWTFASTYLQPHDITKIEKNKKGTWIVETSLEYNLIRSKDKLIALLFQYGLHLFLVPLIEGDFKYLVNSLNNSNPTTRNFEIEEVDLA